MGLGKVATPESFPEERLICWWGRPLVSYSELPVRSSVGSPPNRTCGSRRIRPSSFKVVDSVLKNSAG